MLCARLGSSNRTGHAGGKHREPLAALSLGLELDIVPQRRPLFAPWACARRESEHVTVIDSSQDTTHTSRALARRRWQLQLYLRGAAAAFLAAEIAAEKDKRRRNDHQGNDDPLQLRLSGVLGHTAGEVRPRAKVTRCRSARWSRRCVAAARCAATALHVRERLATGQRATKISGCGEVQKEKRKADGPTSSAKPKPNMVQNGFKNSYSAFTKTHTRALH